MKNTWQNINNSGTSTHFLAFPSSKEFPESLGTAGPSSFGLSVAGKTVLGACGTVHQTFYGRKTRRVRDQSGGDVRVYVDLEIRRVLLQVPDGETRKAGFVWYML
jgi:hypothetical protein